ncbi:hypothetical protein GGF31_004753 [Allomyces arbusculus]|nr:hypothetical protein GGF31_004753 [Allomyces arbusculus]
MNPLAALLAVVIAIVAVCTSAATAGPAGMNIMDVDYTSDAVTYFNKIRTAAKLPAMRANEPLTTACRMHARDMAMFKFLSDRGSDGTSTAGTRATAAGYKWFKTGITMGMGYANVDAYLKTMNKDNNRWIVDKDIVDIGAVWARYMPNGQIYYDVCYGAPAK